MSIIQMADATEYLQYRKGPEALSCVTLTALGHF